MMNAKTHLKKRKTTTESVETQAVINQVSQKFPMSDLTPRRSSSRKTFSSLTNPKMKKVQKKICIPKHLELEVDILKKIKRTWSNSQPPLKINTSMIND